MSKVLIKRTADYDEETVYTSIKYVMEKLEVQRAVAGKRVLLKPNMLSKQPPSKAITTHPQILAAVIKVLLEWGVPPKDMLIADCGGGTASVTLAQSSYNGCGFTKVSEDTGVPLYTKVETVRVKTDGAIVKEFEIIAPAAQYDVIINLAKFKTHAMTGMSGAVKNLFGTIPGLKKAEFHMRFPQKESFAKMLVDLCQTIKPSFTIVDGVVGMEGDGPSGGVPIALGLIIAGENPYYIDHVMCGIMGLDPMSAPVMQEAIERGLCPKILPQGTVEGDTELYKKWEGFVLPKSYSVNFAQNLPRAISWATPAVERLIAPRPRVDKSECIGCEKCREICPQQVITMEKGRAHIDQKGCIKCFCCHEMCPVKAIEIKRFILFK
ncbi:MAG: DUF362 domain-containing protein [Oscillospiraceae bacterium]